MTCPNCGLEKGDQTTCPHCGSSAETLLGALTNVTLMLLALVGAAAGTCGLIFTVASISQPNARDDLGVGPIAVGSLVIGSLLCTLCMRTLASRKKK